MSKVIAYCGMVCSDCDLYIATMNNDEELRKELAAKYTTEDHIAKPEDFYCEGCFKIKGEGCEIRQCAAKKQHENCAACDKYSCDLLNSHFVTSPDSKITLDEIRRNR